MKLYAKICCAALILIGLGGCATDDKYPAPEATTAAVRLNLSAGVWQTRAFTNTSVTNVNRILVMPFVKNGDDAEPDKNYVPVSSQAVQMDLGTDFAEFPINDLTLRLWRNQTYKLLILGYNSADYDNNNPTSASNKFGLTFVSIAGLPNAQSLWNLSLDMKNDGVQVTSCEVFSGIATTDGSNEEFTVQEDVTLTVGCTLKRINGGLSIGVTDIPANVTSMTLLCDQRIDGVWLTQNGEASSTSTIDGEITSYTVATATPSGGEVMIDTYLLNTVSSSTQIPTRFAIEVLFDDATTEVYPVRVFNPATSVTTDEIQIVSNQALNVSGSFSNFVFLMDIGSALNLDDNLWDGYN